MTETTRIEPVELDGELVQNPHDLYRRLRREPVQPAVLPNGWPGWLVTSYEDARRLLADPRLSKDVTEARKLFPPGNAAGYESSLAEHMLDTDPPDHTRLRKLVNKAFTSRAVGYLRPRIERIAGDLLDEIAAAVPGTSGSSPSVRVDLMEAYALPLPIAVICELLGVPFEDRKIFREWSLAFISATSQEDLASAALALTSYLAALIESKRTRPADDLLSRLVHVSDEGDQLAPRELINLANLLLFAGFETTVNLIANGVFALLCHPDQLSLLRSDPSLLPGAIEEFLRYDGAVHLATVRFTREPVRVGNTEIPEGQLVHISLLAANRDGDRFADPDKLDITRQASGHLAFGHGIHHCVGAPLARMEAQIAIDLLLRQFPEIALDADETDLRWRGSILMHGLYSLPVKIGGS